MTLVERLEALAKRKDWQARRSATENNYNFGAADLRELLEQSATCIGLLESRLKSARDLLKHEGYVFYKELDKVLVECSNN